MGSGLGLNQRNIARVLLARGRLTRREIKDQLGHGGQEGWNRLGSGIRTLLARGLIVIHPRVDSTIELTDRGIRAVRRLQPEDVPGRRDRVAS